MEIILSVFCSDSTGDVFQQTLWSFLMRQIIGEARSKEVGDRFEVWRVERQKLKFDTVLSRRLIHLHNNQVGRGLSLTFDIGEITREIFNLAKDAAKNCLLGLFTDPDFIFCGITEKVYSPEVCE